MRNQPGISRRHFLQTGLAGTLGLCLPTKARGSIRKPTSCILLWMEGGPSQIDTFDPKPGTKNGGPFKAIPTSVPDVMVCEHLPRIAERMNRLTLIRSLVSREASHQRAKDLLRAGLRPCEPIHVEAFEFGQGCREAVWLVESGAPFVQVTLGGWDTHRDNFTRTQALCEELDPAFASLVDDLLAHDLWDSTLLVWMGEFGRKPRLNTQDGRDHHTHGWSVVLGGCGLPGGLLIGRTSEDGFEVVDCPVSVPGLFHTIHNPLGLGQQ